MAPFLALFRASLTALFKIEHLYPRPSLFPFPVILFFRDVMPSNMLDMLDVYFDYFPPGTLECILHKGEQSCVFNSLLKSQGLE